MSNLTTFETQYLSNVIYFLFLLFETNVLSNLPPLYHNFENLTLYGIFPISRGVKPGRGQIWTHLEMRYPADAIYFLILLFERNVLSIQPHSIGSTSFTFDSLALYNLLFFPRDSRTAFAYFAQPRRDWTHLVYMSFSRVK